MPRPSLSRPLRPHAAIKRNVAPSSAKRAKAKRTVVVEEAPTIVLPVLNIPLPENLYVAAEIVVLAAQLALVDAAFSGDWSRIGVITQDTELLLQKVVAFIVIAHTVVALLTAQLASKKGLPVAESGVKGFLFGTMELYKVYQK